MQVGLRRGPDGLRQLTVDNPILQTSGYNAGRGQAPAGLVDLGGTPTQPPDPENLALGRNLFSRIKASGEVYQQALTNWRTLEEALAGIFPSVMPTSRAVTGATSNNNYVLYISDQVNLNMLLRITQYMVSLSFDELPSLEFSRDPDEPIDAVVQTERLGEMLLDEGEALWECRRAVRYLMTRGSWIMWPVIVDTGATPTEIRAGKIAPEDYVMAARTGQPLPEGGLPPGTDYYAVAQAARHLVNDPVQSLSMSPQEEKAVEDLAEHAETKHAEYLNKRHPLARRSKVQFVCTPYGSWCRWDPSVTDFRFASWVARKIVMDPMDFRADERFKPDARKKVQPGIQVEGESDPSARVSYTNTNSEKALEENGRIVIWEMWDKKTWKRHYICDGYDGTIELDDSYPYLDEEGCPILPNFFPCVVRTPMQHNRERPEQSLGIPFLAPGWPMQIELIRTRTAYYNACKRSGRQFVANQDATQDDINSLTRGDDVSVLKTSQGYDQQRSGPYLQALPIGNAPVDYLQASTRIMADLCNQCGVSMGAMTGEPVADTLGQEEIALKGATTTQVDVIKSLESGVAELAMNALILFRAFASEAEWDSLVGKKGQQPVSKDAGAPTLSQVMRTASLQGRKLTCRFASSTRADDLARLKMRMDFLAMNNTIRDSMQMPFFDLKGQMLGIAKEMDIEGLTDYTPTQAEVMAAVMQKMLMQQLQQIQAIKQQQSAERVGVQPLGPTIGPMGEPTPDGDEGGADSRIAGGGRGVPVSPGRVSRGQAPQTTQQIQGGVRRAATAQA